MKLQLLILSIFTDNFASFKPHYKLYQSVYSLTDSTYSRSTIRAQISALLQDGLMEKIVKNSQVYFSLTLNGFRKLVQLLPGQKKPAWDSKWRIVIFNIAEKDRKRRDKLRQIVKKLGFGKLSSSVYITPFNIQQEVVKQVTGFLADNSQVFLFEANRSFVDNKRIAMLAFNLAGLRKYYRDWVEKTRKISSQQEKIKLLEEYFDIVLRHDPSLPEILLPERWPLVNSWKIFIGLLGKDR